MMRKLYGSIVPGVRASTQTYVSCEQHSNDAWLRMSISLQTIRALIKATCNHQEDTTRLIIFLLQLELSMRTYMGVSKRLAC